MADKRWSALAVAKGEHMPLERDDSHDLLHSIGMSEMLKNFGYLFSSAMSVTEMQAVYLSSYHTKNIARFISHSWSASRAAKWAALADLYYRQTAMWCANCCLLLGGILGTWLRFTSGREVASSAVAFLLYTTAPLIIIGSIFLLGHTAPHAEQRKKRLVDRACIPQTDVALQKAAISRLEDFVRISERLTILWSEDYFERFWCIFEVAVYGSMHGSKSMEFVPLWLSPFLCGLPCCNVGTMLCSQWIKTEWFAWMMAVCGPSRGIGLFWVCTNFLPEFAFCGIIRNRVRKHKALERTLAHFKLTDTKVTLAADRAIVCDKIRNFFKSTEAFEAFVQSDPCEALMVALGRPWDIPYSWGLVIFQPYMWFAFSDAQSVTNETLSAQVDNEWGVVCAAISFNNWFMWLTLPFALKAVGALAATTHRMQFFFGMCLDVFLHLLVVFILTTLGIFMTYLLFYRIVDATLFQAIPVQRS